MRSQNLLYKKRTSYTIPGGQSTSIEDKVVLVHLYLITVQDKVAYFFFFIDISFHRLAGIFCYLIFIDCLTVRFDLSDYKLLGQQLGYYLRDP